MNSMIYLLDTNVWARYLNWRSLEIRKKIRDINLTQIYTCSKAISEADITVNVKPSRDDFLRHLKTARYTNALRSFIEYTQWLKKYQIYRDLNYHQLITNLEDLRENIPYNNESKEVDRAFDQKIIQTWLEAFHLTSEIVDLSLLERSEIIALEQYLYANSLMVQCKKAALRVSQETWEGIESQMLLPVKQ